MPCYLKKSVEVYAETIGVLLNTPPEDRPEWFKGLESKGVVVLENKGIYVATHIGNVRGFRDEVLVVEPDGSTYLYPESTFKNAYEEINRGTSDSDQDGDPEGRQETVLP